VSAIPTYPQRHAISADEYLRMASACVFLPDARLELMDGEIIEMAPIGSAHAAVVNSLSALLNKLCDEGVIVSVQNPMIAGDRSVPQPDVALLKMRTDKYFKQHPVAQDVLLVIEVSDTTLRFDLEQKTLLYAKAGIIESWVVDVEGRAVHVFRDPTLNGYRSTSIARGDDTVCAVAVSQVSVVLRCLWPSADR
jgi:Uma2 family endonuclease